MSSQTPREKSFELGFHNGYESGIKKSIEIFTEWWNQRQVMNEEEDTTCKNEDCDLCVDCYDDLFNRLNKELK